jgi:hypothetical protein
MPAPPRSTAVLVPIPPSRSPTPTKPDKSAGERLKAGTSDLHHGTQGDQPHSGAVATSVPASPESMCCSPAEMSTNGSATWKKPTIGWHFPTPGEGRPQPPREWSQDERGPGHAEEREERRPDVAQPDADKEVRRPPQGGQGE